MTLFRAYTTSTCHCQKAATISSAEHRDLFRPQHEQLIWTTTMMRQEPDKLLGLGRRRVNLVRVGINIFAGRRGKTGPNSGTLCARGANRSPKTPETILSLTRRARTQVSRVVGGALSELEKWTHFGTVGPLSSPLLVSEERALSPRSWPKGSFFCRSIHTYTAQQRRSGNPQAEIRDEYCNWIHAAEDRPFWFLPHTGHCWSISLDLLRARLRKHVLGRASTYL